MKKSAKKLTLSKETLHGLTRSQITNVAGGNNNSKVATECKVLSCVTCDTTDGLICLC